MTALRLTPEMLEAAYYLLRVSPPFNRWKLPPADEVEFHVMRFSSHSADCVDAGHAHVIRVSAKFHPTLAGLLETMAHEMCHLRQHIARPSDRAAHGGYFKRLAKSVCRVYGFDPKAF